MVKPSIPQGTRDFGPEVVRKRGYIFKTIRDVFELYGYQPLETPAMENLETLTGKYGEEGDKLIFKILNNGLQDPKNRDKSREAFDKALEGKADRNLTERALRYDLTIPFARYVAMNHGQLTFPYKRYQMQPVWRADRPQKGRYREFYQCDVDVVGSRSLLNEVEMVGIYGDVFERLGMKVEIRINSRKILSALAALCGGPHRMTDITVAIDKLDKIGLEKVKEELTSKGIEPAQLALIETYLGIEGPNEEKLSRLGNLLGDSPLAREGIQEISYVLQFHPGREGLQADLTLARGLNYYTGLIFEVKSLQARMGSLGGGGRYDDLTGLFGVPDIPGAGISFGVDRIYDVLEELQLFPGDSFTGTQVLFFNMGEAEAAAAFGHMQALRERNIRCEIYHEAAKLDKQFKYADKKRIAHAVIIGTNELAQGTCVVKDLRRGEQQTIPVNRLSGFVFEGS